MTVLYDDEGTAEGGKRENSRTSANYTIPIQSNNITM